MPIRRPVDDVDNESSSASFGTTGAIFAVVVESTDDGGADGKSRPVRC